MSDIVKQNIVAFKDTEYRAIYSDIIVMICNDQFWAREESWVTYLRTLIKSVFQEQQPYWDALNYVSENVNHDEKFGLFNMLVVGILIYIFICIYSLFITSATDFFILAGLVGLVQGGVQSVSRTIFSRLIPEEKATEFFGFYNLIGKSAVVVGPALVGWMAYIFNNPKAGIISLLILFIPGILILFYVPRASLVRD